MNDFDTSNKFELITGYHLITLLCSVVNLIFPNSTTNVNDMYVGIIHISIDLYFNYLRY